NEGYSMIITSDEGFAVTGNYFAHPSNNDIFFLKADSMGFMGCGEVSTYTTMDVPAVTVTFHPMTYYPTQPSVVSHFLNVKSGMGVSILCDYTSTEEFLKEGFVLYPNPVKDHLFITLNDEVKSVRVFNIYAEEIVESTEIKPLQTRIDCSRLIPGIYMVSIETKSGVCFQKFVKE